MNNSRQFLLGAVCGLLFMVVVVCAVSGANVVFNAINGMTNNTPEPTPTEQIGLNVDQKLARINRLLEQNYIDGYTDETAALIEKFYADLVSSLGDPYTVYMNTDQFKRFLEDTEGVYAGIGVVVGVNTERNTIKVVSPFEGSPGAAAGILPGDEIVEINGTPVTGDRLDEAVKMMKGEPGTTVIVTIARNKGAEKLTVTIKRDTINIPTVSHKVLDGNVGYLRITSFDAVTYQQFMDAFNDLQRKKVSGLIIDLRNNPGGRLDVVTAITDKLIPKGIVTYTEDKNGKKDYLYSESPAIKIPLVLLVNGGSASASEVLTGAVIDTKVGIAVGTRTFGKGIVQKIFELPDGSAVKITTSKYYTPSGVCIQGIGIEPQYVVEMDEELSIRISSLTIDEDVQLKKAHEVIMGQINKK